MQRRRVKISLYYLTAAGMQKFILLFGLNSFGNGVQTKNSGQSQYGFDDLPIVFLNEKIPDKRSVYFQMIKRKLFQVA